MCPLGHLGDPTPNVPDPILSGGELVHLGVIISFYSQMISFTTGTFGCKNILRDKFSNSPTENLGYFSQKISRFFEIFF